MPRKKTQEQPTEPVNLTPILDVLNDLKNTIGDLTNRIEKLENKEKETIVEKSSDPLVAQSLATKGEITYAVPMEYGEIVHSVLNKKFGVKVEPMKDRPEFMLTIIVPPEYSNMTEKEKEMYKTDLRSKIISYAEGSNGVKLWAEQIYKNLGPEIQARITEDRKISKNGGQIYSKDLS
uniref:Uncharacterized protein n=1 Tax=candidate division CPR3 bacterium TaxID=2268181 RepID=A0A7V3JAM8_UNCC3